MATAESARLALYNRLAELLGSEPADTLMSYLPSTPASALATKDDVHRLESRIGDLEDSVGSLRIELRSELHTFREELRGEMTTLKDELRGEMTALESGLRGEMTSLKDELRSEMTALESGLRREMATLKDGLGSEMATLKGELRGEMTALDEARRGDTASFKEELREMREDIRHLGRRMDRMQQTTFTGFVALVAALVASGFLT